MNIRPFLCVFGTADSAYDFDSGWSKGSKVNKA